MSPHTQTQIQSQSQSQSLSQAKPLLAALPAELRSKIYSYIFTSSVSKLTPNNDDKATKTKKNNHPLLHLLLLNKSTFSDLLLYSTFLRTATITLSSLNSLHHLTSRLTPTHLSQIRNITIRPVRSTESCTTPPHIQQTQPYTSCLCPSHGHETGHAWQALTIDVLLKYLPNLRTLAVQQGGVHINTFHRDLEYTIPELTTSSKSCDRTAASYKIDINTDTETDQHVSKRPRASSRTISNTYDVAADFSTTLTSCIKRTAPRYGRKWYLALLRDAIARDIEVIFTLELMFLTEAGICAGGVEGEGEWWEVLEDVSVSTRDWMLKFEWKGREWGFRQGVGAWLLKG